MKLPNDVRTHFVRNTVLWNASLAMALLPWMQGTAQQDRSQRFTVQVRDECTFSDGAKITFGHTALAKTATGGDVWQTGNFQATAFRVSARTIIPPMDSPIDILPGLYTLFVDPSKGEPWTLIISKKDIDWALERIRRVFA